MDTYKVVAQLPFPKASPGLSGLQAPTWIGGNKVDVLLPSHIGNINGGEVDTIVVPGNLKPFVPTGSGGHHTFPAGINCQPADMALQTRLGLAAIGCGFVTSSGQTAGSQLIYNNRNNKVVAVIHDTQGVDIVDTTTQGYFLFPSCITNLMYVTDRSGKIVQQVPTSDLAHGVTFDLGTGEVFVPTGGGVVAVYQSR